MKTFALRCLHHAVLTTLLGLAAALVGLQCMSHCFCSLSAEDFARTQLMEITRMVSTYRVVTGRFPSSDEGLGALTTGPRPLLERMPRDPWGKPYAYRFPGDRNPFKFDIISAGADRTWNTEDDLGNWPADDAESFSEAFLEHMALW